MSRGTLAGTRWNRCKRCSVENKPLDQKRKGPALIWVQKTRQMAGFEWQGGGSDKVHEARMRTEESGAEHVIQAGGVNHTVQPGFKLGKGCTGNQLQYVGGNGAKALGQKALQGQGLALQNALLQAFLKTLHNTLLNALLNAFLNTFLLMLLSPQVKPFCQCHFQLL